MNREQVVDLIADAGYGFLATAEGSQPRVRPVAPVLTDDNQLIVAVMPQKRSIAQIKENPLVEVCFVDRKMCFCRVSGSAKLSDNSDKKQIIWDRMPMLRQYFGGPEDPNFILMEIEISGCEAMTPSDIEPVKVDL